MMGYILGDLVRDNNISRRMRRAILRPVAK